MTTENTLDTQQLEDQTSPHIRAIAHIMTEAGLFPVDAEQLILKFGTDDPDFKGITISVEPDPVLIVQTFYDQLITFSLIDKENKAEVKKIRKSIVETASALLGRATTEDAALAALAHALYFTLEASDMEGLIFLTRLPFLVYGTESKKEINNIVDLNTRILIMAHGLCAENPNGFDARNYIVIEPDVEDEDDTDNDFVEGNDTDVDADGTDSDE